MHTPRPHDLLWGLRPEHLPQEAPAWARVALGGHVPVVVRRAAAEAGWVAVGIRGAAREHRYASWMRVADIRRLVSPEAVARAGRWRNHPQSHWPALRALAHLQPRFADLGLAWGVTGSLGFELASGVSAAHLDSDLDLLLRALYPLPREWARTLCSVLDEAPGRIDVQLETPLGAVALREWASAAPRVLLKTQAGPLLLSDPWRAERTAA
ncbi:MAG: malonate decarboxylase holo-ACP synthase [Gammaproteobacteria bacterium]|nr:malonate decarboxylase holo-ACP synthase [Gammaproteobacteria bacterium]MBU1491194.1 malonate decarboxylase holo-ACP synthase [Gammaproteobacteria bacterium]MBU2067860.1 malonate decarboxylase holo-ACP synthase [Gammaproteobacteria bacterium]MBU2139360.1 malonate decarboxylase holo-ACP synthase [Gammaproteobacteria bacterium]MBU2217232.1 malonate decarboxylase holo-ACP synthase [Gammaproteobacteria bacterium]